MKKLLQNILFGALIGAGIFWTFKGTGISCKGEGTILYGDTAQMQYDEGLTTWKAGPPWFVENRMTLETKDTVFELRDYKNSTTIVNYFSTKKPDFEHDKLEYIAYTTKGKTQEVYASELSPCDTTSFEAKLFKRENKVYNSLRTAIRVLYDKQKAQERLN